jgi:Flp pilus assembly protein CpaB
VRRAVRRRLLIHRRLLAALCCGVAVAAGVHAVAAPPPPSVAVTAAAHDLPAGQVLAADDLTTLDLPPGAVPDGAGSHDDLVGRTLAAPLRAGEPVTDVRLLGAGLAAAHPGLASLPVRLPDPGQVALLAPGDRIDLLATDPQAGGSRVVASDALVLAVPPADDRSATTAPAGALVVLGVAPASVPPVAEAAARFFLSYAFSH